MISAGLTACTLVGLLGLGAINEGSHEYPGAPRSAWLKLKTFSLEEIKKAAYEYGSTEKILKSGYENKNMIYKKFECFFMSTMYGFYIFSMPIYILYDKYTLS